MIGYLKTLISEFWLSCKVSVSSVLCFGSWQAFVAQVLVEPVLDTLLYLMLAWAVASSGPAEETAAALAAAVAACAMKTIDVTSNIFMIDRYYGTLPHVLGASGRTGTLVAARLACGCAIGFLSCLSSLGVLGALGMLSGLGAQGFASLAALVLATCIVGAVLGLFVYAVSLTGKDELLVLNVAGYVLPLACGSVAAVSSYPAPLAALCNLVPVSGLTEAARLVGTGAVPAVVAASLGAAAVWLVAAVVVLRVGVRRQCSSGTVDVLAL
ncbi:hypothetical protein [Granulimonas faecalis]|uniref:hypothetical protein n=1 Tax=Granulimonas faecalis TaxID=2894155 RepID=UPI003512DB39